MESSEFEQCDDITKKAWCTGINELSHEKLRHEYNLYVTVHKTFDSFLNRTVHNFS